MVIYLVIASSPTLLNASREVWTLRRTREQLLAPARPISRNWVVETASGNLNLPFTAIPDEPLIKYTIAQ